MALKSSASWGRHSMRQGKIVEHLLQVMVLMCLMAGPAMASEKEYPVNSTTIRSVIEASRQDNGDIVSLRKNIGLYILEDDASDASERDLFNKLVFSEMQLFGRMLPLSFKSGARPRDPVAESYSQLVIFRDPDDMKIAEYESVVPGFVAAVESVKAQLRDNACLFFYQQDA